MLCYVMSYNFNLLRVTARACPLEQSLKRELLKALTPSGIKEPKRANFIQ